jgi:hypothetical protein
MANQILIVKQPLYGTVVWDGVEFKYTPKLGFSGTDYYIYTSTNGVTSQTITEYVNTNNLPPIARDIALTINAADLTTINVTNYVSDPNTPLEDIKVINLTKPAYGVASFVDNIITYQSNGFNTKDVFSYTVSDGQYISNAKIEITVINGANPQIPEYILNALDSLESDMNVVSINSGGWQSSYTLLSSKSAAWNSIDPVRYNNVSNIVETNSADWNAVGSRRSDIIIAYNTVNANSADWNTNVTNINTITTTYESDSGSWMSTYNTVCANSGNWEQSITDLNDLKTYFSNNSSNWDTVYTTVCTNSALWDKESLNTYLSTNSGYWVASYEAVTAQSGYWNETYNGLTALSTLFKDNSGDWNSTYNTVCSYSALWDKSSLTTYLSTNSGNWDSAYTSLCGVSSVWNDLVVSFSALSTNYFDISGNWESTYTTVSTNSALWDKASLNTYLSTNSGNWNSVYTTVCAESAKWDGLTVSVSTLSTSYDTNSGKWNSAHDTVYRLSADWDNTTIKSTVQSNSSDWNVAFNVLTGTSGNWNSSYFTITSLSSIYDANSGNWETTYSFVCSNSAGWGDKAAYSILTGSSADWNSSYTTLCGNSGTWNAVSGYYQKYDSVYNELTASSGNWYSTYNTVTSNSGKWDSLNTTVNTNSAKWLSGSSDTNLYVKDLIVSGNAVFYGSLTAQGTTTQLNTEVVATSTFAVVNTGFVDALQVSKTETTGAIASFQSNGNPVLYVSPLNRVGINTSSPNEALTVFGNISASGTVYGNIPPQYTTYVNNSSRYENAYTFFFDNSAGIKNISDNKTNYYNAYTFLTSTSGNLNDIAINRYDYYNAYNVITSQSAQNYSSYTFLTANSSNVGTDTLYRSNSAKYESAASYINTITNATAQINFIFDGGGEVVDVGSSGMIQIPYKTSVVSWALLADAPTIASVQVLSSDYNSYPTYTLISGNINTPFLNGTTKSNNSSSLTDWLSSLNDNTILKFKLMSNSAATSITLSLKCTKY